MPDPSPPENLILVATIAHPHGLAGAVRLRLVGEPGPVLGLERLYLEGRGWRAVRGLELHNRVPVLSLLGVASRQAAEALFGVKVYADEAALPLEPGSYFYANLVGRPVRSPEGAALGEVTGLIDAGAQDLLVVARGGAEYLVPLQADYVRVREEAGGLVIEVEPIPGLLDDQTA